MLSSIQANFLASTRFNPYSVDEGNFMSETNKATTSLLYKITDDFQLYQYLHLSNHYDYTRKLKLLKLHKEADSQCRMQKTSYLLGINLV